MPMSKTVGRVRKVGFNVMVRCEKPGSIYVDIYSTIDTK